jgi:hypothetical protein
MLVPRVLGKRTWMSCLVHISAQTTLLAPMHLGAQSSVISHTGTIPADDTVWADVGVLPRNGAGPL